MRNPHIDYLTGINTMPGKNETLFIIFPTLELDDKTSYSYDEIMSMSLPEQLNALAFNFAYSYLKALGEEVVIVNDRVIDHRKAASHPQLKDLLDHETKDVGHLLVAESLTTKGEGKALKFAANCITPTPPFNLLVKGLFFIATIRNVDKLTHDLTLKTVIPRSTSFLRDIDVMVEEFKNKCPFVID